MPSGVRQESATGTGKKKFGKNLNKLVKSTAPPIANDTNSKSKANRNGLLLLSTKKSGSGLLSTKSTPAKKPNLQLQYESTASTHDVLLSAVVGASQEGAQQQPDAWGVAEKQQQQQTNTQDDDEDDSNNNQETVKEAPEDPTAPVTPEQQREEEYHHHYSEAENEGPRYELETSWDEYGGRGGGAGGGATSQNYMSRLAKERAEQREQKLDQEPHWERTRSGTRGLWEPEQIKKRSDQKPSSSNNPLEPQQQQQQQSAVIHLSSYEDQDRGERNTASARMLFDPKSGSMVAVKQSRDEPSKRKERGKKKKTESKPSETPETARKPRSREDTTTTREAKATVEKAKKAERRLPRTCGVLYARGPKGNFYCADGCEGDLGYGMHSVPGGRSRNPEAYTKFIEQHQQMLQTNGDEEGYDKEYGNNNNNMYESEDYQQDGDGDVALYTGFNPEEAPEPVEWIKADDKIELVTGIDDSPTLKPTAKEWAPSQAALAAAAAAAKRDEASGKSMNNSIDTPDDVDTAEEEEGDDDAPIGLGFDPTQDMDFVMHSPSAEDENRDSRLASLNLNGLSLEPPVYASATTNTTTAPRNIFSFGTSGTWGSGESAGAGNSDWGVPGNTGGLFGTEAFSGEKGTDATTTFLNLPHSNSWGSPSMLPTNGDGSTKTAD